MIKTSGNDLTPVSSLELGVYNDSNDSLTDSSDIGDISTQPSGAAYSTQTVSLPGDLTLQYNASNNYEKIFADQTYDTSDSTQTIDAYFAKINYQADGDGSATDHLYFTGILNQSFDLSGIDSFVVSGSGLEAS